MEDIVLLALLPRADHEVVPLGGKQPDGRFADTGDAARVEITKTDAYDLIGRVVEILPQAEKRRPVSEPPAHEKLHRITTGAPLRVLG